MPSNDYIWAKVVHQLEDQLSPAVISSWIDDAELVELNDDDLILHTPTDFRKEVLQERFAGNIHQAMLDLYDKDLNVIIMTDDELRSFEEKKRTSTFFDLNPQYTFDKFVVGGSNAFAYNAAIAVAKKPASINNPLFIYGPSGLGKTHLLYAIANEVHRTHPEFRIVYIKGDQFLNELYAALKDNKNIEFRDKYRNSDLFLVDDIQFIAGKERTQEEFFHTFNSLYEAKKQIVLTSDQPPSDMLRLHDRLITRFEQGLVCDIMPPDYETRMLIIRNKAEDLGLTLSDEVCNYIANNVTNNVRQLEGTVKRLKAIHDLQNVPLDLQNVSRSIKAMFHTEHSSVPTPALIIAEVARFYSIDESALRGKNKDKGTSGARHVSMYLIRKLTNLSTPEIAKEYDVKDHTAVLYAIRKMESALKEPSNPVNSDLRDIEANINSHL